MKIMIQMSVLACVEVKELPGMAAKVDMPRPIVGVQRIFIPTQGESDPDLQAVNDLTLIATAHILKFLSDGAQEELKEIGEPVLTQAGGNA